jgi:release factor glutamine methyltransferase
MKIFEILSVNLTKIASEKRLALTLEREYLLSFVLGVSRSYLIAYPDQELLFEQQEKFDNLWARRMRGEPLAYMTGRQAFWDIALEVTPDTLIPRSETELLVEYILDKYTRISAQMQPFRVLDLGTGTGAIGITLAKACREWEVLAVDSSRPALIIAEKNARQYQLSNIKFLLSNWYTSIKNLKNNNLFNIIVSNPPYISEDDNYLSPDVKNFEPVSALISPEAGLADLKIIITQAPEFLISGGLLIVEHGFQQGPAVQAIFKQENFKEVVTLKDIQGHPRATLGFFNVG